MGGLVDIEFLVSDLCKQCYDITNFNTRIFFVAHASNGFRISSGFQAAAAGSDGQRAMKQTTLLRPPGKAARAREAPADGDGPSPLLSL